MGERIQGAVDRVEAGAAQLAHLVVPGDRHPRDGEVRILSHAGAGCAGLPRRPRRSCGDCPRRSRGAPRAGRRAAPPARRRAGRERRPAERALPPPPAGAWPARPAARASVPGRGCRTRRGPRRARGFAPRTALRPRTRPRAAPRFRSEASTVTTRRWPQRWKCCRMTVLLAGLEPVPWLCKTGARGPAVRDRHRRAPAGGPAGTQGPPGETRCGDVQAAARARHGRAGGHAAGAPLPPAALAGRGRDGHVREPRGRVRLPEGPRTPQRRLRVRPERRAGRQGVAGRVHRQDLGRLLFRRARRDLGARQPGPLRPGLPAAASLRTGGRAGACCTAVGRAARAAARTARGLRRRLPGAVCRFHLAAAALAGGALLRAAARYARPGCWRCTCATSAPGREAPRAGGAGRCSRRWSRSCSSSRSTWPGSSRPRCSRVDRLWQARREGAALRSRAMLRALAPQLLAVLVVAPWLVFLETFQVGARLRQPRGRDAGRLSRERASGFGPLRAPRAAGAGPAVPRPGELGAATQAGVATPARAPPGGTPGDLLPGLRRRGLREPADLRALLLRAGAAGHPRLPARGLRPGGRRRDPRAAGRRAAGAADHRRAACPAQARSVAAWRSSGCRCEAPWTSWSSTCGSATRIRRSW